MEIRKTREVEPHWSKTAANRWIVGVCALTSGLLGCAKAEDDVGERGTAIRGGYGNDSTDGRPVGAGDSAGVKTSVQNTTGPEDDPGVDGNGPAGGVAVTSELPVHSPGGTSAGGEPSREAVLTVGENTASGDASGGAGSWGGGSGAACGARAGDTCEANEYCAYAAGQYCGAADAEASCKLKPTGCTREYAPVCGCDGNTYANACTAAAAGTGVRDDGECPTESDCEQIECLRAVNCAAACGGEIVQSSCCPCPDGMVDVEVECKACGGFAGPTCDEAEYCAYEADGSGCGILDASAVCKPRPDVCTQEVEPVCGCDGKTYSNACAANAAGVGISSNQPCEG